MKLVQLLFNFTAKTKRFYILLYNWVINLCSFVRVLFVMPCGIINVMVKRSRNVTETITLLIFFRTYARVTESFFGDGRNVEAINAHFYWR